MCYAIIYLTIFYLAIFYFSMWVVLNLGDKIYTRYSHKHNIKYALSKAFFWPIFMPKIIYEIILDKYSTRIINHFKKEL